MEFSASHTPSSSTLWSFFFHIFFLLLFSLIFNLPTYISPHWHYSVLTAERIADHKGAHNNTNSKKLMHSLCFIYIQTYTHMYTYYYWIDASKYTCTRHNLSMCTSIIIILTLRCAPLHLGSFSLLFIFYFLFFFTVISVNARAFHSLILYSSIYFFPLPPPSCSPTWHYPSPSTSSLFFFLLLLFVEWCRITSWKPLGVVGRREESEAKSILSCIYKNIYKPTTLSHPPIFFFFTSLLWCIVFSVQY